MRHLHVMGRQDDAGTGMTRGMTAVCKRPEVRRAGVLSRLKMDLMQGSHFLLAALKAPGCLLGPSGPDDNELSSVMSSCHHDLRLDAWIGLMAYCLDI